MEKSEKTTYKSLLSGAMLILLVVFIFSSCNQKSPSTASTTPVDNGVHPLITTNVSAIVKDAWRSGSPTTEANDSVLYSSGSTNLKGYANSSGDVSLSDNNYTAGNPIVMEACANNEICGKVFNQALTKATSDPNYNSPTFTIEALSPNDSIPIKVLVTDMNGNPYSGYSVQITQGGSNYGSATTTNSSGLTSYSRQLTQGQTYVCTATGTTGNASATVSTSALSGSSGKFSGIAIYIRF